MHVYSDLIEPVHLSDVQAQFLDVVAAQGDSGDLVSFRYNKLHCHPLFKKRIADIHITLRDNTGEAIKFETGNSQFQPGYGLEYWKNNSILGCPLLKQPLEEVAR